jgi:hypothetical protein
LAKGPINKASAGRARLGFALASLLALVTIAGLDFAYLLLHWGAVGQIDSYHWANQDFRDAIYYSCQALFRGINPYDIDAYQRHFAGRINNLFPLYSPLIFLLHFPLALLPYHAACWTFQAINFGLLLACVRLTLSGTGWRVTLTSICTLAALILLSEPGRTNLLFGQVTWSLVLASYLGLTWARQNPQGAGVALAITSFKPTYFLPIAFFMLCRGDFKALAYGLAWTIALTAAGLGFMAACGVNILELPKVALANHSAVAAHEAVQPGVALARVDVPVFLIQVLGLPSESWAMYVAPLGIMLITGWLVAREARQEKSFAPDSFAMLLICLATLFGIFHYVYDLLLLTLPFTALFTAAHPSWQRLPRWGLHSLRLGALLLAFNVFWTGPAVRIARFLAARWPDLLEPWAEPCWQFAKLLNPVVLTSMWGLAVLLCFWPRRPVTPPSIALP